MAQLKITTPRVQLLLTGTKDLLRGPVQETINVDKTFHHFLGKVMTPAHIDKLPGGLMINRANGYSSFTPVSFSCSIRDFLATHFKRELPIYRIRLFLPKNPVTTMTRVKATVEQRSSPRIASATGPALLAPSTEQEADEGSDDDSDEDAASNENRDNGRATHPSQGSGEAEAPKEGPADPVASAAFQEGSIVGEASASGDVAVEKWLQPPPPKVKIGRVQENYASRVIVKEEEENSESEDDTSSSSTLVPTSSQRTSTTASSVVSVPIKAEMADWETDSVLDDMRRDGVDIVDLKTQSHRRLAGVPNTLLLLAMEEKRKMKDNWLRMYGRAPVCARILEELLKE